MGLSTAMQFAERFPSLKILLLEKENSLAAHQTGHNSGVIHSGIYYKPGSLKARLCVQGVQSMVRFAQRHQIPYELCGKLILATSEREVPWLQDLYERGHANGVPDLKLVSTHQIKDIEPRATGLKGLYSPRTGIIDFKAVADTMARQFEALGGTIKLDSKVSRIVSRGASYGIETSSGEYEANNLINCAGLYADKLARMAGIDTGLQILPFRGEYCLIREEKKHIVKNLIYPVPLPELPFLGVHFTRTVDGKLEAGPNAILALAREGYRRGQVNLGEFAEMISSGNFWKMAGRNWKTGIFESYRAFNRKAFLAELQKMVPDVQEDDLMPGPSGVRAQCVDQDGSLVNDFKILEAPRAVHVLNVPSPAATASLSIGEYIVELAAKNFGFKESASEARR